MFCRPGIIGDSQHILAVLLLLLASEQSLASQHCPRNDVETFESQQLVQSMKAFKPRLEKSLFASFHPAANNTLPLHASVTASEFSATVAMLH